MTKKGFVQGCAGIAKGLAAGAVLSGAMALAQFDTGSITGRLEDATGAAIPGGTVTIRNLATGVTKTLTSNQDGTYQALALIPGSYAVEATATGFSKVSNPLVDVHVKTRAEVDFSMVVGSAADTVEVNSAAVALQTQSADVGNVIGTAEINDLPLNARRYADLALLEPGIFKNPAVANAAPDRFSSNGNLETQNYFALDGVDNNSGSTNLQEGSVQNVQPPPDAIQEFRLQTRTYSTEFGTSAGAVVNATTKSGTNKLHGSVWDYVRNSALDSNTYFNRQRGIAKGSFSQNQFGGTVGGPIVRDHAFIFGDYQGLRSSTATTKSSVVPSAKMKTGDFTELSSTAYPFTAVVPGQVGCITPQTMKLLPSCIDPVAAQLAALYPDPNDPTVPVWNGSTNYNYVYSLPQQNNSFDVRFDEKLSERNQMFARYSLLQQHRQDAPWTSNLIIGNGGFATDYSIRNQGLATGLTTTLSSTAVNQLRFGWSRDSAHSNPIGLTLGTSAAATYGLTGIPASPYTAGLPPLNINSFVRLGVDLFRPQFQAAQVWQVLDNFNKLVGNHSLTAGYEYHRYTVNFLDLAAPQGYISSSGIYSNKSGFGLVDFLLGDVNQTLYTTNVVVHNYQPGNNFYVQDVWRASDKLTLTYGTRYELYPPMLNRTNALANFSTANGGSLVQATGGDWYGRSTIHPDKNNFAPRVGFSYQASNRMVLRGGYGVFYQYLNRIGSESQLGQNQPFLKYTNNSQNLGSTTPIFFIKNGFPGAQYSSQAVPLTIQKSNWQDPNQRTGYVQQMSFGPQFQISGSTIFEAVYVGNFAHKMNRLRNANQGVVTGYANATQAIVSFPYANLNTATTAVAGAGTHAFLEYATNDGNTNYNALELSLRRQMTKGLAYQISYTYAHNFSDYADNLTAGSTPQNAYDYEHEYSQSPFDQRHRFVASGLYRLPIGKDGLVLNNDSLMAKLIGGFQVNTIVTLQAGNPFTVTAADASQTGGNHAAYANCVGDAYAGATRDRAAISTPSASGRYLNMAAFAQPTAGTFGSCRPRSYAGPGRKNVDASLFKQFAITEAKKLELRLEMFNLFNHANFANPSAAFTTPGTFGKVSSTVNDPRQMQVAAKFYF